MYIPYTYLLFSFLLKFYYSVIFVFNFSLLLVRHGSLRFLRSSDSSLSTQKGLKLLQLVHLGLPSLGTYGPFPQVERWTFVLPRCPLKRFPYWFCFYRKSFTQTVFMDPLYPWSVTLTLSIVSSCLWFSSKTFVFPTKGRKDSILSLYRSRSPSLTLVYFLNTVVQGRSHDV